MAYPLVGTLDNSSATTSSSKPKEKLKPNKRSYLSRDELIETAANILEEMIQEAGKNYTDADDIPNKAMFHAQKRPAISIKDYMLRFGTYSKCHDDAFVYLMIYLDRIGEKITNFELDSFNIHRFVLVSLVMACKFYDDNYYKNSYYAKIGGISTVEFNQLELEYLTNNIQFELYVDTETYTSYYDDLLIYHQDK